MKSNKTKHTPAPWIYNQLTQEVCGGPDGDYYIAMALVDGNHPNDSQEIANLKLIAAAPDLLSACLAAYHKLTSSGKCNDHVIAEMLSDAINKATK